MKTYARIENDTVVELFETAGDIREMFHPAFIWVEIHGAPPAVGWLHVDGAFSAPPTPPFGPVRAEYLDTVRTVREKILNRLPGIGFAALMAGDAALAQAVDIARKALLAIPSAPAVLEAADPDGLKAAVLATYRAIVADAPAELVKAFTAEGL